ncbi:PREDICTED: uncharacterized protein LOC109151885 [Ipomoea nil]|uniref:uncharacterized protein LOC109151885 n=1 Tax=Ipomoea nil TaxID=35883 RepID=UPI000901532E|nr:PREDICTED: uncharacterized protein LOC109151885 [Ipomoea nil]
MAKAYYKMEWPFLRRMLMALGFVDRWVDLLMMCVTTVSYNVIVNGSEAGVIKQCLSEYEVLSGQSVNFHKSSVCFNKNTGSTDRDEVVAALGVVQANDFGKYLGLPSFIGRNKKHVFAYIGEKIAQRIGSWNKKLLSRACKEILLKTVVQAMPTFSMSVFLLNESTCLAIQRVMNRYYYGRSGANNRGIHWMAWD